MVSKENASCLFPQTADGPISLSWNNFHDPLVVFDIASTIFHCYVYRLASLVARERGFTPFYTIYLFNGAIDIVLNISLPMSKNMKTLGFGPWFNWPVIFGVSMSGIGCLTHVFGNTLTMLSQGYSSDTLLWKPWDHLKTTLYAGLIGAFLLAVGTYGWTLTMHPCWQYMEGGYWKYSGNPYSISWMRVMSTITVVSASLISLMTIVVCQQRLWRNPNINEYMRQKLMVKMGFVHAIYMLYAFYIMFFDSGKLIYDYLPDFAISMHKQLGDRSIIVANTSSPLLMLLCNHPVWKRSMFYGKKINKVQVETTVSRTGVKQVQGGNFHKSTSPIA